MESQRVEGRSSWAAAHASDSNIDQWVKGTNIVRLLLYWILMAVVFAAVFSLISFLSGRPAVDSSFTGSSEVIVWESALFSLSGSFLLGYGNASSDGIARLFFVMELFFGVLFYGLLISRAFLGTMHFWPRAFDNTKNKKVNTIALMFSIFRHDIDSIIGKVRSMKSSAIPQHLSKELEASSEELYLGLLEVELLFTSHGKSLAGHHLVLLLDNVETALSKVKDLLHSMASSRIKYASKTFIFNLRYSMDLAEKIARKVSEAGLANGTRLGNSLSEIRQSANEIRNVL